MAAKKEEKKDPQGNVYYQFRVKDGFVHNNGLPEEAVGGDVVELTIPQAKGLMDKFVPVNVPADQYVALGLNAPKKGK